MKSSHMMKLKTSSLYNPNSFPAFALYSTPACVDPRQARTPCSKSLVCYTHMLGVSSEDQGTWFIWFLRVWFFDRNKPQAEEFLSTKNIELLWTSVKSIQDSPLMVSPYGAQMLTIDHPVFVRRVEVLFCAVLLEGCPLHGWLSLQMFVALPRMTLWLA